MRHVKLLLIFSITLSVFSCAKDELIDPIVLKNQALKASEWVIMGFTTADNTPIDPALFSGDAKFINQLTYIFENTGTVRSYDKVSKQAQSYGTWGLIENATKLEINIQGFKGTFEVIELSKSKMILRNNIKYNSQEIPVNMVFIPLK
jgi:hypothetical protein